MIISAEAFKNLEDAYEERANATDLMADLGYHEEAGRMQRDLEDFENFIVGLEVSKLIK